MLLTGKEKEEIMEFVKSHKRSKNEEWLARHFANIPQGWKEENKMWIEEDIWEWYEA